MYIVFSNQIQRVCLNTWIFFFTLHISFELWHTYKKKSYNFILEYNFMETIYIYLRIL